MVVIYWIALPLCVLAFVASFATVSPEGRYAPSWTIAPVAAALAGVIGWRLWLYRRALGAAGPLPSGPRVLSAFLPRILLAVLGVVVILLGLAWTGFGLWLALDPPSIAQSGDRLFNLAIAGGGLLTLGLGAALNWPLLRLLTRRPAENPSPVAPVALDTHHD